MKKEINTTCKPILYSIDEKIQNIISLNKMYKIIAYLLSLVFLSIIVVLLFDFNIKNFIKLVVPLGIILSAAIASLSVLKSIDNANLIEKKNKKVELERAKLRLSLYLSDILESFSILNFAKEPNYLIYAGICDDLIGIRFLIEKDKEVLNLIHTKDILLLLSSMRKQGKSVNIENIESETNYIKAQKNKFKVLIPKIAQYNNITIYSTIS